jgi:hypothetical protein
LHLLQLSGLRYKACIICDAKNIKG